MGAVDEHWTLEDDECISCTCKKGYKSKDVYAECVNTCLPTAEELNEKAGCGLKLDYEDHVPMLIEGMECLSIKKHAISMCTGACVSESIVKDNKPVKACNCCSAVETELIDIEFDCEGYTYMRAIEVPTMCSCGLTSCGLEDEPIYEEQYQEPEQENNDDDDDSLIDDAIDFVDDAVDAAVDEVTDVIGGVVDWFGGWW